MATLADAPAVARRAAAAVAGSADSPRRVAVSEAPFLAGSPTGVRFRGLPRSRALVRGAPADVCPVAGLGVGPDPAAAIGDAFGRCLAARPSGSDCACRLLAVDDVLTAEPQAFAYAPGVGGRLVGLGEGARPLTIEERATNDPALTLVAFFDAGGPVAVAELSDAGAARLVMVDSGATYEGRREPRGWRRGRLTERLLLRGADGERLIALIGFEPADIAAEGARLGAWPREASGRG